MARLAKSVLVLLVVLAVLVVIAAVAARRLAATPDRVERVAGTDNVHHVTNKLVSVYLIDLGSEAVLIDAGIDTSGKVLQTLVEFAGKTLDDISAVFITHGHSDHFTGLAAFAELPKTFIGREDAALMDGTIRKNDVPGLVLNNIFDVRFFEPDQLIDTGGRLPLPDGEELLAIHAPGHTPGSYLFYYNGILFIGDTFNYADGKLTYPPAPVTADMPRTIRTISRFDDTLQGLDIRSICTSHGGCTPPAETASLLTEFVAMAKADAADAPGPAAAAGGQTEYADSQTIELRVLSERTFSGRLNDEDSHPVLVIDDLKNPRPIGPGRGAGGYVFLNNRLLDWESGEEAGVMHGYCFTVDHGPDGPWQGAIEIGLGGPFASMCQTSYLLEDGEIVAIGSADLNAMELDEPQPRPIVGGTGAYRGASGSATVVQDPPGQPITYKATLEFSLP